MNKTFYVVDCCTIPHFGNHLTRAAHFMSYLHDILNTDKSDISLSRTLFPVPCESDLSGVDCIYIYICISIKSHYIYNIY